MEANWRPEGWASPHWRMWLSYLSLKFAVAMVTRVCKSFLFSGFTSVMARQVAVFFADLAPPAATFSASLARRSFFSVFVSGLRLLRRRNSWEAWRLSKVLLNWLIAGG